MKLARISLSHGRKVYGAYSLSPFLTLSLSLSLPLSRAYSHIVESHEMVEPKQNQTV